MSSTRHSIYSATVNGTSWTQINSQGIRPNSSKEVIIPGGGLDAGAVVLNSSDPSVVVSSNDFTTIFGAISISAGLNCSSGATFRFQKRADGSTFTGGSNNVTLSSTQGFAKINSISADQDRPASVEVEYKPTYDSSTLPLVVNTSVSFSATPAFVSVFYLGPVYVNSSQVEGVTSVRVDPGVMFDVFRGDGDLYAKIGSVVARRPSISITFRPMEYVSSGLGNVFLSAPAGAVACYFLKGAHGSSARVASGSSVHAKVGIPSGGWNPDDITVSGEADSQYTVTIHPTATITLSVTSAVP